MAGLKRGSDIDGLAGAHDDKSRKEFGPRHFHYMITTRLGPILRIVIAFRLIQFENIYSHSFTITGIWLLISGYS